MLENLITDRTAADVERWQYLRDRNYSHMITAERDEWSEELKGAYNATDLNRVGNALNYLHRRLAEAGYMGWGTFVAHTTWESDDIPTADDLTYYLNCVSSVREALAQLATTPPAPENRGTLDYIEANNIEQILLDIDKLIDHMLAARNYCGELLAGEV